MDWKKEVERRARIVAEVRGDSIDETLARRAGMALEELARVRTVKERRLGEMMSEELFLDEELMRLHPYRTAPGYGALARRIVTEHRLRELSKRSEKTEDDLAKQEAEVFKTLVEVLEDHEALNG